MPNHGREPHLTWPSGLFLSHGLLSRRNQNAYLAADSSVEEIRTLTWRQISTISVAQLSCICCTEHITYIQGPHVSSFSIWAVGLMGGSYVDSTVGCTSPGSQPATSPSSPANPPQATPESPDTNSGQVEQGPTAEPAHTRTHTTTSPPVTLHWTWEDPVFC